MRRVSQDVWVVIFLVMFLLAFGSFAVKKQTASGGIEMKPRRTSYSATRHGLKALYETLDKLHYRVRRQTQPFTTEPDDGVLLVAAPEMVISDQEWSRLHDWIERGNLLIIADDTGFDWNPGEKLKTAPSTPCAPSFLPPGVNSYRTEESADVLQSAWKFGKEAIPCKGFG